MKKFGFEEKFIRWIRLLYTDIEGCVINNGFSSKTFLLQCGVRQGCPMSPYLFIIVAEILAIMIRQDKHLKGLNFENIEMKISQYADDTVLFLQPNEPNLRHCFSILDQFNCMSGLKINVEKCSVIRLGSFNDTLCQDKPLSWPSDKILYLGITIPLDGQNNFYELNLSPKLEEIKKILSVWALRNLTLYGKIVILKTLAIPKLIYSFSILPNAPEFFFSNLQRMFFEFLWNNKGDKIKRSILYNDYLEGGLKMPHVYSFNNAIKVAWVKRYLDHHNDSKWKFFLSKILQRMGGNNFFSWNFNVKDSHFLNHIDQFWRDVLLSWSSYKYYNPVKFKDIVFQPLWFNSFIQVDKKVLFVRNLFDAGVIYLKDISNMNGSFLRHDEVVNRFGHVPYLQYYSLISAIPVHWKRALKHNSLENIGEPVDKQLNSFLEVKKITKYCYNVFVKEYCTSVSDTNLKDKWQHNIQVNLDNLQAWNLRFALIYKSSIDNTIRNFQFKFLHRKISTNEFLFKIGIKSSPLCNICENLTQTMNHLFLECTFVESFWKDLNDWLCKTKIRSENLSNSDICFGVVFSNNFVLINTIILYAKKFIFSCNYNNKRPSFIYFKHEITRLEKIERCIAFKRNTLFLHKRKWNPLLNM